MLMLSSLPEETHEDDDNRLRDTRSLIRLLSTFNTHAIDDFIDTAPANGIITFEVLYYYDAFSAHVSATAFHIFDEELARIVHTFADAWDASMGYGEFFFASGLNRFVRFQLSHEVDDPTPLLAARQNFIDDVANFAIAYSPLIEHVRQEYPEIDLIATNQAAYESLPDEPEAPETDDIGGLEEDIDREDTRTSQRMLPDISCKRVVTVVGSLIGIPAFCLVIFVIFFGDNLCNQMNPPQWTQPVLDIICPEEPDPEEKPAVSPTPEIKSGIPESPGPETWETEIAEDLDEVDAAAGIDVCRSITLEISEIMFIPLAPGGDEKIDYMNEYVEIHNYGDEGIDAEGLWMADTGGHPGSIVAWSDIFGAIPVGLGDIFDTEIPANGYGVILPVSYESGDKPYSDDIPDDAIVLTLQGTDRIGNGLVAKRGYTLDVLVLYTGTNNRIDCEISTYGTPNGPLEGRNPSVIADNGVDGLPISIPEGGGWGGFYRVHSSGNDVISNWTRFYWTNRTPGAPP